MLKTENFLGFIIIIIKVYLPVNLFDQYRILRVTEKKKTKGKNLTGF